MFLFIFVSEKTFNSGITTVTEQPFKRVILLVKAEIEIMLLIRQTKIKFYHCCRLNFFPDFGAYIFSSDFDKKSLYYQSRI